MTYEVITRGKNGGIVKQRCDGDSHLFDQLTAMRVHNEHFELIAVINVSAYQK